jgi:predicted ATPase
MLSHIRISNDLALNLDDSRLHAFVGQNDSGKTFALKYIKDNFISSYYSLEDSALRRPSNTTQWNPDLPIVQSNGWDLPIILDCMRKQKEEKFLCLEKMFKRIIPNIETITLFSRLTLSGDITEVFFNIATHNNVSSQKVSKGTIFTLGLLAILLSSHQSNLVLLDDIEQGLHPVAQRELMTVIKEIVQTNPSLQVVFSTHSPYIVDELALSQVHVFSNQVAGGGTMGCKRLEEHPDAEWAKQTLTTGEFWDSVGEDWVTQR